MPLSFQPMGICATQDGRVYVGTGHDNMVYRLRLDSSHHAVVEEAVFLQHSADMALDTPANLGCSDTLVAVSSMHSHVVWVFDHAGTLLYTIGRPGVAGRGDGMLNLPRGVFVDQASRVVVADWGNNRVMVFGAGGIILGTVETGNQPLSVTVNKDRLFVGLLYGDIITYRLQEL